jgi:hypothetical protein
MRRLEKPTLPGACAPFDEPTSASRPACAGRSAGRAASCPPPRRGRQSAAPKVPSVLGFLEDAWGPGPVNRARTFASRRVNLCPQVVPKLWTTGPRLFHPTACPARTEQCAGRSWMLRDDRLETDTSGQHPQRPQDFCVHVDPRPLRPKPPRPPAHARDRHFQSAALLSISVPSV